MAKNQISTRISPEGLEIANAYLELGSIPAVCSRLQIDEAKAKVESVAKETETSVNKIVNTDNFDPGASNATDDQNSDQNEKSIQEELKEVSDHVEEVAKEIYEPNGNPKAVNKESTNEETVKQNDGVS